MYPDHTSPTENPHRYPGYVSTLLQEVKQFDYLGLRLNPMVNMKTAVSSIQEKANKAHSLVLAVSYSLRYDKHHSNPTICSSPVEMLNLWKSCVLPHFLLYLRYIMMMIAFITIKGSLVPLIEGLCAQIYFRFEISVVCSHLLRFFFVKEKTC